MKTKNRSRLKTMRELTPTQLDTLTRVFYGEFYIVKICLHARNGAPNMEVWEFRDQFTAQVLTGRMASLFRRRLIQNSWSANELRAVYVTPKGIEELAKHLECTVDG